MRGALVDDGLRRPRRSPMTASEPAVMPDALRALVREKYGAVATDPNGPFHFHTGRPLARRLGYDPAIVDRLPDRAVESFAGVANPLSLRSPEPGERVVDLGSGGGFDCFVAAHRVGRDGRVIGVDMTAEMLAKSRATAEHLGLDHVEFREGILEDLPVESGWADLVISNGVLNLVADKAVAFAEAFRILRPGGCIAFADIAVGRTVPAEVTCNIGLWTDCIAGGQTVAEWQRLLRGAGFVDCEVGPPVDTFEGARGEGNARAFDVLAHPFLARRPS
jgi:arsenite methyltransferase